MVLRTEQICRLELHRYDVVGSVMDAQHPYIHARFYSPV
jgi:hypothetical protein